MSTDQCLNDLRKAREFIERGWCKYQRGSDVCGHYREGYDPLAIKWCALGAIDAALGRHVKETDCAVLDLAKHVPPRFKRTWWGALDQVAGFNNDTSQEAGLALFDKAIADHLVGAGFAAFRAATLTALDVSAKP